MENTDSFPLQDITGLAFEFVDYTLSLPSPWAMWDCLLDGYCAHFSLSSSGDCSLLSPAPGEGERQLFASQLTPSLRLTIPSLPLALLPGLPAQDLKLCQLVNQFPTLILHYLKIVRHKG